MKFIVFLIFLFQGIQESDSVQSSNYLNYYKKAKTSYFYSLGSGNGYHELDLTKRFLDSASTYIKDVKVEKYQQQFNVLNDQVNSSNEIATDNINYIIPAFSSLAGYRDDFNIIDDSQELLIEQLLDNIINQSEPNIKAPIKNNQQFIISNINPYNDILSGVVNDFINSNSNLYHIQNHEIFEILGNEGFLRFKNNQLTPEDFKIILENYGIDIIYNISIDNKPTLIDKLYYSGVNFKVIKPESLDLFPIRYYEDFRIDKIKSFRESFLISTLLIVIIFLINFLGFNNVSYNFKSFNKENFISDSIILLGLIISIFVSVFLLRLIRPELNAFIGEFYTKLWIALSILIPIVFTLIISTLLHTKFSKYSSTDLRAYRKFLFVSISAPIILFNHYIYYSHLNSNFNWLLISLYLFIIYFFIVKYLSVVIKKYSSITFTLYNSCYLFITIVLFVTVNFLFVFENLHITYLGVLIIPFSIIGIKSLKFNENFDKSILLSGDVFHGLENPYEYISDGLNFSETELKVESFIQSPTDFVLFLEGASNIGKTRFLKEYMNANSNKIEFFYGDFNEFKEGALQTYEPFYEAFCLHHNPKYRLDKNFFNDRSKTFKNFKKVADIAMSSAPLDLGEIISIDDNQNLSLNEISTDLVNTLLEFSESKFIIVVLDDYQWVDSETNDLLISLIKGFRNRGAAVSKIKIILSISDIDINLSDNKSSFKLHYENLLDTLNDRFVVADIKCIHPNKFFDQLFKKEGFKFFKEHPILKFSESFKIHLKKIIAQNNDLIIPGYLFNYISLLEKEKLVTIDSQLIHLIKEPPPTINYKDSLHLILKNNYEKLEIKAREILESAAHIGFKFDAGILSSIWKKDIINIIQLLETIENIGLIKDESNYDNIYSFNNKNFHKWLRSNHNGISDTDHRQKIIEIQKRIISSVVDKGEDYLRSLDIDILKSLSYRCKIFEHVGEIKAHTIRFNLLTALKLAQENKIQQSATYVQNIKEYLSDLEKSDINVILEIFNLYLGQQDGLKFLDIQTEINNTLNNLLNVIFDSLIKNSNKIQRSKSVLYNFKDICLRELNLLITKELNSLTSNEKLIVSRLNSLSNYRKFVIDSDELEVDFYSSIIDDKNNYLPLLSYRKSANNNENLELVFNINMQLINIFKRKEMIDQMFIACHESLNILSKEDLKAKILGNKLGFNEVKQTITRILSDTNISLDKAKKLSSVVLKYIESYFLIEDFKSVIKLTSLIESLVLRSRLSSDINEIWPLTGASYFKLGEIDNAERIYFKHFYFLIDKGASKEDFMHPIDGIIHCCKVKNDFNNYDKIKKELYKHMLYMSDRMMNVKFSESKIDGKKPLSQVLAKSDASIESENKTIAFARDTFQILYTIANSDGEVHRSEVYDIIESVNAINVSLGFDFYSNLSNYRDLMKIIDGLKQDELLEFISTEAEKMANKYDKSTLKSVYHLCVDICRADGVVAEEEERMLDILKSKIVK